MDFDLSPDQVALAEVSGDLLSELAAPARVHAHVDAGGGLDRELWSAMVAQGWAGLAAPESVGGVGLGWVEVAVLAEQLGRRVAPAPFVQHALAVAALGRALEPGTGEGPARGGVDDPVLVRSWLERLAVGEGIGTVAWRPVQATSTGAGWTLSGTPEPVVFGPCSDLLVVASDDGVFAVDLAATATRPAREAAMDLTRELGWVRLDATPAVRLGGAEAVAAFADAGAATYAAELLGIGAMALDLAVAYAGQRQQFGRPIGSFQAVKHRCADMLVDVEAMRSAAWYAAWCVDADDPDRAVAAATAKTWCSEAGPRVVSSCLQIHGGIGFTWECDVHLYLKRAQLDALAFGDATFHRARLGELLRARVEAGTSVI